MLCPSPSTDDREESDDTVILQELENIDDDLDAQGIHIVKIADDVAEREYGIEDTPCLVYFEKEVRMTGNPQRRIHRGSTHVITILVHERYFRCHLTPE